MDANRSKSGFFGWGVDSLVTRFNAPRQSHATVTCPSFKSKCVCREWRKEAMPNKPPVSALNGVRSCVIPGVIWTKVIARSSE